MDIFLTNTINNTVYTHKFTNCYKILKRKKILCISQAVTFATKILYIGEYKNTKVNNHQRNF